MRNLIKKNLKMKKELRGWYGFVGVFVYLLLFGLMMFAWHDTEPTFIKFALMFLNFGAFLHSCVELVMAEEEE